MNGMKAVFLSDRGKIRTHNEDNGGVLVNQAGIYLAFVADGMGGHRAGDVASSLTLKKLKEYWDDTDSFSTPESIEEWFIEHINRLNQYIFEEAGKNPECQGMGTTIVAAIVTEQFATIANVGDSRCYILNDEGFKQLTEDHSLVNELVKTGQISKEDAENHPRKNVLLRALGTEPSVEIDIKTITFEEGNYLLLCSDGLSNKLSNQEMEQILLKDCPINEKAQEMIDLANQYGGEDNITLIILEFNNGTKAG